LLLMPHYFMPPLHSLRRRRQLIAPAFASCRHFASHDAFLHARPYDLAIIAITPLPRH
jgi:hypothetical protein